MSLKRKVQGTRSLANAGRHQRTRREERGPVGIQSVAELRAKVQELQQSNQALQQRINELARRLTLLHDITRAVNEAPSWDEALRLALREICKAEGWQVGYVYLPNKEAADELIPVANCEDDQRFLPFYRACRAKRYRRDQSLPGRVYAEGIPIWVNGQEDFVKHAPFRADVAREVGLRAAMALPVTTGQMTIAVLEFFSDQPHEPSEDLTRLMNDVSAQVSRVLERERLMAQAADLVWREQQNLVHTVHDSLGQELTGLGMLSAGLSQQVKGTNTATVDAAQQIAQGAQRALEQVRQLAKGLFPVEVDAEGFMLALRQLASTTESLYKVRCRVENGIPVFVQDNHRIATELYRIAQEAVTNALKHAKAREIVIRLGAEAGTTTLTVADDGIGIPKQALDDRGGMGLRIMRYRAMSIGANLSIERGARAGTQVTCTLREAPRPKTQGTAGE